jgi:PAP2 superfamily
MRALMVRPIRPAMFVAALGNLFAVGGHAPASANVITDWDEKALAVVVPALGSISPYPAQRMMGLVHAAMFDAVNSIERRYQPCFVQLPASPSTSKDAAAAAAAVAVLATIDTNIAEEMKETLVTYLAPIPDGVTKTDGVKLGEAVAAKIIQARSNDGSDAPDDYRPRTVPGVYVPTTLTLSSAWPNMKPFVIVSASQFRPGSPISLNSEEWAKDYNEIKEFGRLASKQRTADQTETARFWLVGPPAAYHPFARQLVSVKQMSVIDSARFMTLVGVGLTDAIIAVLDAKYHYNFWRPITAIRNGDIDGNPSTDREATWLPMAVTPMHPEYPCAHCVQSGTVAGIVYAVLGSEEIPEIAVTSPTAPGVIHGWTNMRAFTQEIADARIWAGFHYRFSTVVGTQMGYQIGEYVARNAMKPVVTDSR